MELSIGARGKACAAVTAALLVGLTGQALGAPAHGPQDLSSGPTPPSAGPSEIQPQVAVAPRDQRRIAVAWDQQTANGFEIVLAQSGDGGGSWVQTVPPGLDSCGPAALSPAVADPSLSFDADGRLYLAALCYVPGTTVNEELVTSVSPLGQWASVADLGRGTRGRVVADPTTPGTAYLAYLDAGVGDTLQSVLARRTSDGGRTWSAASTVYSAQGDSAIGPDLAVIGHGPAGATLVAAFHGGLDTETCCTYTIAVRSTDSGAHWESPVRVPADGTDYDNSYADDPQDGSKVYGGGGDGVRVAGDGAGTAYAVWSDVDASTHTGRVLVARMTTGSDGRASWGSPVAVDPSTAEATTAAEVFEPVVSVGKDGTVAVVYYDDRHRTTDTWVADLWYAVSADHGASWVQSHVAGPFDLRAAVSNGATDPAGLTADSAGFTDSIGMAAAPDGFLTAYDLGPGLGGSQGAREGRTDVFLSLLRR